MTRTALDIKPTCMFSRKMLAVKCLFLFLLWPAVSSTEEKFIIKFASIAPKDSAWSDTADSISRMVAQKTQGQAKVVWYLGGVMGDEPEMIKKIRTGQIHGGAFTLVGLGKITSQVKVLELPFLFRSYTEVDYVLKKLNTRFSKLFEDKGFVLPGWLEVGFVYIFSKSPISKIGDLSGIKMWTWADDVLAEAVLKAMGIRTIVPLNLSDVLPSLKSGRVDAYYGPAYATLTLQWHPHVKYVTDFTIAYTPAGIVIDKKFMASLPGSVRDALILGLKTHIPKLVRLIREDEKNALDTLQYSGMTMIHADDEFLRDAQTRTWPLYKEFAEVLYPSSLLAEILDALKEYRKK